MPPDQQAQVMSGIFNSASNRGLALTLDTRVFTLGIDPKSVENHQNALANIEQTLLCREDFTPEELEDHIISLHGVFAKGTEVKGGEYRDGLIVLQGDNVGIELKEVVEIVRQKEPRAVKKFKQIYREFFRSPDREQTLKNFTEEEKRIFGLAFDFDFPFPNEVSTKMKQFCCDYVAKLHQQIPAIEFASWIHDTLIEIHPWEDLNGHVSRALVSGELARKGHIPFLIFDHAKYNKAVRDKWFKDHLIEALDKVRKIAKQFSRENSMKKVLVKV